MASSESTIAAVEKALAKFNEPLLGADLISTKSLKDIQLDDGRLTLRVVFGFPCAGYHETLQANLARHLRDIEGVRGVDVEVESKVVAHVVQKGVEPLKNIRNIIAVASGKGGVGKSTVAANLALALKAEGAAVGMLDADIYGPSQPRMLGAGGRPESNDGRTMEPVVSYGVQSMSIGYLVEEETPMIWRGPMVTQALEQLLKETNWANLDYLIVDLPPGTGDIQLTLSQKIPVAGAVIVTTPQDIALLDARKGFKMFEKVGVPVLGVVENMSIHICSKCGHEERVFGEGGGERMSKQYGIDLLGVLPLQLDIRLDADAGEPTVVKSPDSRVADEFRAIARRTAAKLAQQPKNYAQAFPNIMVQN
ncbi:MAG: iron-sulfur cluster carrier protein ApbC [Pseudomonadota bacterium]